LIPAVAFLRAISGQHAAGLPLTHLPAPHPSGVEITKTSSRSASFKIRAGQPCGAKVALGSQEAIYDFLETLVEFVFPRLKDWPGVPLPAHRKAFDQLPSSQSGSLTFGLPKEAMALFPQIEMQLDSFPKLYGCHVHVVTNARGAGAEDRVRALLSGLRIPFVAAT
jgi:large subunit ribosomal protein L5